MLRNASFASSKKLIDSGTKNLLLHSDIEINCPIRLLHGSIDKDVPVERSLKLLENLQSKDLQLTIVRDANHQFSTEENLVLICKQVDELTDIISKQ